MKYQLTELGTITRKDGTSIPQAPGNTDYEEYLQWLAKGNTPDPAIIRVPTYKELRKAEYPPAADYLDGVVNGDQKQIDDYIAACKAVKLKYPKV